MAESLFGTQSPLNCPICLNLLKNPVTTSCGHSFCMNCIKRCWDQEAKRGVFSCPTCRMRFNQRPALGKSKVLADILEGMKQEALAGPGDVKCDVCKGRNVKAIRSCLVCMASYCRNHIRPHLESKAFKIHKLVKASPDLQQQICPQHHRALEVYCYNDRRCVCVVCMGDEHSGHKVVSAADAMARKQEELKMKKRDFIQKTNDFKEEVYQCKKAVISYKQSAQAAVEHSDKIFSEIICSIQKRQAEVRENIRAQENKEVRDAENHIQTLEKEICELQEENRKLEPLLQTKDHVYFFQWQKYSVSSGVSQHSSSCDVGNLTFERVEQCVSELKNQLDEVCEEHMGEIFDEVADVLIFQDDYRSEEEEEVDGEDMCNTVDSGVTETDPRQSESSTGFENTKMAESAFDPQSPLNCPICLNLLQDPVTTTCGHSFCMDCINRSWNLEVNRGVFSCPACRKTFNQRPALSKSKVLADILEGMKQEAPAGLGDVKCDVCTGRKGKAIKSCLVCMASYCQTHIRPHYESEAFKIHKLVEASPDLQQQICPQHHRALEVYCHDDRKCVCVVCMGNQHRGHRMVSAADEMAKKQEELKIKKREFIQKTKDKVKEVQQFKEAVISYKRSAQAAVEHSDKIFSEIICSIQKRQAEVRENIRAQENKEVRDAENHIQTLEKEIFLLQKENRKLEQLLETEHHAYFFQNNSLSLGILQYNSSKDVNNLTFERAKQSLSAMKNQLDEVCQEHMGRILSKRVIKISPVKKRKREPEMDSVESVAEELSDDDDSEDSTDIEDSTDTIQIESSFPDSLESI